MPSNNAVFKAEGQKQGEGDPTNSNTLDLLHTAQSQQVRNTEISNCASIFLKVISSI